MSEEEGGMGGRVDGGKNVKVAHACSSSPADVWLGLREIGRLLHNTTRNTSGGRFLATAFCFRSFLITTAFYST